MGKNVQLIPDVTEYIKNCFDAKFDLDNKSGSAYYKAQNSKAQNSNSKYGFANQFDSVIDSSILNASPEIVLEASSSSDY